MSLIEPRPGALIPAPRRQRAMFRVARVAYSSLAKFGCLLGGVLAFLPSLLCGLTAFVLVRGLRGWIESWRALNVSVLGNTLTTIDLIELLKLNQALDRLRVLDSLGPLGLLGTTVTLALLGGLFVAILTLLGGMAYNLLAWLTGGIVLEVEGEDVGEM